MGRRRALIGSALVFVTCGIACVDLFHSTDFDTLCTVSPTDPRCDGDAATTPDVVAPDTSKPVTTRPHPDFCSWDSARAKNEAAHACAWLGACEGPVGESAFGPCMVRAQLAFDCTANKTLRPGGAADAFWSCLSTVTSCAEVDGCAFPSGVDTCGKLASGNFKSCGNANPSTLIQCTAPGLGRALGTEPCAMRGKTCTTDGLSEATCTGTPGDHAKNAIPCIATECLGTVARACASTINDDGFDCASQGATCVTTGGVPACASSAGPTCAVAAPPACVNDTIVACVRGHELSVDCSLIGPKDAPGLGCDATLLTGSKTYDLTEACWLAAAACTGEDRCNGTTLTSCGRGATYEVDCGSVGLTRCETHGAFAACLP